MPGLSDFRAIRNRRVAQPFSLLLAGAEDLAQLLVIQHWDHLERQQVRLAFLDSLFVIGA